MLSAEPVSSRRYLRKAALKICLSPHSNNQLSIALTDWHRSLDPVTRLWDEASSAAAGKSTQLPFGHRLHLQCPTSAMHNKYGGKVDAKFPSDFYTSQKKKYIYVLDNKHLLCCFIVEKDRVREGRRGQGAVVEFHKGKRNKNKI